MIANLIVAAIFGVGIFESTFTRANEAYSAGDYADAIKYYEQLINERVLEPEVFFNLGNSYYRSGRIAGAMANYERALRLDPNFEEARDNLDLCVSQTERKLQPPQPRAWEQSLLFWHYLLSQAATRRLAVTCWVAFWVLLGIRQWRPMKYIRRAAAGAFVLAVAFAGSAWVKAHPVSLAIADRETVPVYYGKNESETVHFELFLGDRVVVDKQDQDWARVKVASGERGWARADDLVFVGPPYEALTGLSQNPAGTGETGSAKTGNLAS